MALEKLQELMVCKYWLKRQRLLGDMAHFSMVKVNK